MSDCDFQVLLDQLLNAGNRPTNLQVQFFKRTTMKLPNWTPVPKIRRPIAYSDLLNVIATVAKRGVQEYTDLHSFNSEVLGPRDRAGVAKRLFSPLNVHLGQHVAKGAPRRQDQPILVILQEQNT